ncbi:MAG TPA: type II 3-dehydroquinate dehydratase [Opitutae bacterium]|nr:type II 3-dehydroquinate dehydratase [Opitutae bacterium]
MKTIAVLNGPNLTRLGARQPEIYGKASLEDLHTLLQGKAKELGLALSFFQSNHEGALVDEIGRQSDAGVHGLIINPAAFSHTSIALRDAIECSELVTIEVHISNIYSREPFRHHSVTSEVATGVISGLGFEGYSLALQYLAHHLNLTQ